MSPLHYTLTPTSPPLSQPDTSRLLRFFFVRVLCLVQTLHLLPHKLRIQRKINLCLHTVLSQHLPSASLFVIWTDHLAESISSLEAKIEPRSIHRHNNPKSRGKFHGARRKATRSLTRFISGHRSSRCICIMHGRDLSECTCLPPLNMQILPSFNASFCSRARIIISVPLFLKHL